MGDFASRRAALAGMFARGPPPPPPPTADDEDQGTPVRGQAAARAPPPPPPKPVLEVPTIGNEPVTKFDGKKKVYPSKAKTGTEGCSDFQAFLQSGGS
jgi:hypothetical protein